LSPVDGPGFIRQLRPDLLALHQGTADAGPDAGTHAAGTPPADTKPICCERIAPTPLSPPTGKISASPLPAMAKQCSARERRAENEVVIFWA
jgi:hypothetical protein